MCDKGKHLHELSVQLVRRFSCVFCFGFQSNALRAAINCLVCEGPNGPMHLGPDRISNLQNDCRERLLRYALPHTLTHTHTSVTHHPTTHRPIVLTHLSNTLNIHWSISMVDLWLCIRMFTKSPPREDLVPVYHHTPKKWNQVQSGFSTAPSAVHSLWSLKINLLKHFTVTSIRPAIQQLPGL